MLRLVPSFVRLSSPTMPPTTENRSGHPEVTEFCSCTCRKAFPQATCVISHDIQKNINVGDFFFLESLGVKNLFRKDRIFESEGAELKSYLHHLLTVSPLMLSKMSHFCIKWRY